MRSAWVRSHIMMIFGAASSWDIGLGAYRATGTELGWMRRKAQGLCGVASAYLLSEICSLRAEATT
jgi:hypothetical protein